MIINIRGTSGSGKSTVVRNLMRYAVERTETQGPGGKVDGYLCRFASSIGKVYIVGRYETACGGCDTIKTQDEVEQRVRLYHSQGVHVIFEGLLISTIYTRWAQLARDCKPFTFVFLDAPVELCVQRVKQRRLDAGNEKELNVKNTEDKHRTIRKLQYRLKDAGGFDVVEMAAESAAERLLVML